MNKPKDLNYKLLIIMDKEIDKWDFEVLNDETSWQIKKQLLKELDYRLSDFWKFMATPLYDQIKREMLDK